MGIQKIGHHSLRNSKRFPFNGKGKELEDIPFLGADLGDDSDDCELTELHCEVGMVEGQLCSIPYELYDLPDLREVLSLETWNSCLTEDERFYLSAYLPDMDQPTFCTTMKELFDGSDLYFGNPLDVFFQRLKGGFYHPKVAQFREGLQFIQRKKYYHSLRSYHNRMTQMFIDMRRLWVQCELSSGVEERISMWNKSRKQKTINLLDLNKFPKDDHTLGEEVFLEIKGMKSVESKRAKDDLPSLSANGMKSVAPNCRGKGVLKMKASGNGLLPNSNLKVIGSDISEQFRSVPKGVLKIVPKVHSSWLEQSEKIPRAQPTFPLRTQGLPDFKFSSLPAYLQFPDAPGLYESPFLRQKVDDSRVHLTPAQQPQCRVNQQESTMRSKYHSESSIRKMEGQIIPPSGDIGVFGQHKLFADNERRDLNEADEAAVDVKAARRYAFGAKSLWPNLRKGTEDFSLRSLESFPFDIQYHGAEQHMAPMIEKHMIVYPRIQEAVQRASVIGNSGQEMLMVPSSNPMRGESDIMAKRSEKLLSKSSVSDRFKDEPVLPLTYKRRKGLAKVSSLDSSKSVTAGGDTNSNQHLGEGAKALKVKFTRWKDMPINKEP